MGHWTHKGGKDLSFLRSEDELPMIALPKEIRGCPTDVRIRYTREYSFIYFHFGQTAVEDCFTILMVFCVTVRSTDEDNEEGSERAGHRSRHVSTLQAVTVVLSPFYKAAGATNSHLGTRDEMFSKGKARAEHVQEGEDDAYGREGSLLPARCMG